jgi:hypothetical protein
VPWRPPRSKEDEPENRALVVVLSVLQLSLIVVAWLLAMVPVGLLALAALIRQALSRLKK